MLQGRQARWSLSIVRQRGSVKTQAIYKDGVLDGSCELYDDSGRVMEKIDYRTESVKSGRKSDCLTQFYQWCGKYVLPFRMMVAPQLMTSHP